MTSVWDIQPADPRRAALLADELGIHPVTAQLLLNRGIGEAGQARRFFHPTLESLGDPFRVPGMERGVPRLLRAIARREPILIFSDSDVDGLTASVILYETLQELGATVRAAVSNRVTDGYGLPAAFAGRIARSSVKLLVLVDCGTNQPDEIRAVAARGIDVVIVDHHVPMDARARPYALINPHGGHGVGRELCSAGLAFKLAQALLGGRGAERLTAYLDLASLGTLADCVPVIGENRIILSQGVGRIPRSHRPGLRRLCEATRISRPEPEPILRRLTPRLNASGRLGNAAGVWKLLRRDLDDSLDELLAATEAAHDRTKRLHRQATVEAREQVSRIHFRDHAVIMVSGRGWHQGIMGPIASQLAQRCGRPAIAIAVDERRGIGSGRSIPSINLLELLRSCEALLVRFGGHAQACGLTIDRRNLEPFRDAVNHAARRSLGGRGLVKRRAVDLELPLEGLTRRWVEETERFAPFGNGNPRPAVLIRRVTVAAQSPRTSFLSDGTGRVAAKGSFDGLDPEERYDVVASPVLAKGEVALTVSEARLSLPAGPAGATTGTLWSRDRI